MYNGNCINPFFRIGRLIACYIYIYIYGEREDRIKRRPLRALLTTNRDDRTQSSTGTTSFLRRFSSPTSESSVFMYQLRASSIYVPFSYSVAEPPL